MDNNKNLEILEIEELFSELDVDCLAEVGPPGAQGSCKSSGH